MIDLTLASTSPFRKSILDKLTLPFNTISPNVDETSVEAESAEQLVERLAIAKATAGAQQGATGYVIGSDQVACFDNDILGKPHNHENAIAQLTRFSGKCVTFYTGLCLYHVPTNKSEHLVETFNVHFKELSHEQIEQYLLAEQPYNCAGSFKSEGLGILLFEKLEGRDPNALIGLPLIGLAELFNQFNQDLLSFVKTA